MKMCLTILEFYLKESRKSECLTDVDKLHVVAYVNFATYHRTCASIAYFCWKPGR